jgi:hypothetical protein
MQLEYIDTYQVFGQVFGEKSNSLVHNLKQNESLLNQETSKKIQWRVIYYPPQMSAYMQNSILEKKGRC